VARKETLLAQGKKNNPSQDRQPKTVEMERSRGRSPSIKKGAGKLAQGSLARRKNQAVAAKTLSRPKGDYDRRDRNAEAPKLLSPQKDG